VVVTERVIVTHQGALLLDAPTREALTDRRVVDVYLGQASEDTDAGS
jgi:ABC-type branched-subunit amino acid transport system ATPase component